MVRKTSKKSAGELRRAKLPTAEGWVMGAAEIARRSHGSHTSEARIWLYDGIPSYLEIWRDDDIAHLPLSVVQMLLELHGLTIAKKEGA